MISTKNIPIDVRKTIWDIFVDAWWENVQAAKNHSWDKGVYGKVLSSLKSQNKKAWEQNIHSRALRGAMALYVYLIDYYNRHKEIPKVNIKVKGKKVDIDVLDKEYGNVEIKFGHSQFTTGNKKMDYVGQVANIKYYYVVDIEKYNIKGVHESKKYTRDGETATFWFLRDISKLDLSKFGILRHNEYIKYEK